MAEDPSQTSSPPDELESQDPNSVDPNDETEKPENDDSHLESVINNGVYGLTGVSDAVPKQDDQDVNPETNNDNESQLPPSNEELSAENNEDEVISPHDQENEEQYNDGQMDGQMIPTEENQSQNNDEIANVNQDENQAVLPDDENNEQCMNDEQENNDENNEGNPENTNQTNLENNDENPGQTAEEPLQQITDMIGDALVSGQALTDENENESVKENENANENEIEKGIGNENENETLPDNENNEQEINNGQSMQTDSANNENEDQLVNNEMCELTEDDQTNGISPDDIKDSSREPPQLSEIVTNAADGLLDGLTGNEEGEPPNEQENNDENVMLPETQSPEDEPLDDHAETGATSPDDDENKQNENNNDDDHDNNENAEDNGENNDYNYNGGDDDNDGMMVEDDVNPSFTNWDTPPPIPSIPSTHSVSHLPPLETTPELDSESKKMLQLFEKKGKIPEINKRGQLMQYVQRQKVNAVVANDFVSAGKYQTLAQKLAVAYSATQHSDSQQMKIEKLEKKLAETLEKLHEFQQQTDQLVKEERQKLTTKRALLENSHEEKLNVFEDHWNDEEFLCKYAKPSSLLLQAKRIERSLVLAKDFEGAEDYRKQVIELEKQESQEAQKRAENEMKKQYKKLTAKQEAEIIAFDDYARRQLELIVHDREIALDSLIARQTALQQEIDELKSQKKSSSLPPLVATSKMKSSSALSHDTVMTPRTAQRYAAFKTNIKKPKLTVKPLGAINQKKKSVRAPNF